MTDQRPVDSPDSPVQVLIDLARVDRNLHRLHARASARGVRVRAHVKGHRTAELALRQRAAGAVGIAVTQLAQARQYVAAGIDDVVIAHPWPEPWRWRETAELARHCRVSAHVDSEAAVEGLADAAAELGVTLGVRVQLGTGLDATATPDDQLLALARAAVARPSLRLDGVTAYQALLGADDAKDPVAVGRSTAAYALRIAALLRGAGLPCSGVAIGGTPTADGALVESGVTEICSGAYALQDGGMLAIGACAPEDVAVTVVATDQEAADRVLDQHPYPWQTAADHQRLASTAPPGARLCPPHICALTPQVRTVTVYEHDEKRRIGIWQVLNTQDTPPTRPAKPGLPKES
ncbi:alanine racemase [Streptomyces sp. NPDC101165]|uniref:alanine racemase n=1 Tax=Streptomyces sp. NPDC101165 TaxID=3366119 RepID=UPI00380DC508